MSDTKLALTGMRKSSTTAASSWPSNPGDLPGAKAKVLYAVQQPFQKALLIGKTTNAAWRSKPSYYAVSTEDRTINPDLERFMAKRMGAKTIEVKASHLSLITHSDEIARLILEAAGQPV
jgi:pimeloyl-ACP methyl ester carboxylesterase